MRFTFGQGVSRGPMKNVTVSLPGGFEPNSTVMVVIPTEGRSEPPTPKEFKDKMLADNENISKGILDKDRVDAIRILDVNLNEVPNLGRVDIQPVQREMKALVVELRTSLTPAEAHFIQQRMERELNSTFIIDTFSRVV